MPSLASGAQLALRKILFATDFSSCSEIALRYGLGWSRHFDATLYTVSVVSAEVAYVQPPDPLYFRHSAEDRMDQLASSDLFRGIKHLELVKEGFGDVSEVLLELIERLHIDLIVLGTHGRSGIKKLVLGSVAEDIVNRAPCAVLTIGPHVSPEPVLETKPQRILCATDLRPASENVLVYALWLAKEEHARLILLHTLKMPAGTPAERLGPERDMAMKQLEQLLPPETGASVGAECIVEIGAPGERILRVAEDHCVDLILIGRHHTFHPRVSAHLPWAMLHQVLCHARCPVLRCMTDVI
jgi:nucleotide-binding universal stress UspA family protein